MTGVYVRPRTKPFTVITTHIELARAIYSTYAQAEGCRGGAGRRGPSRLQVMPTSTGTKSRHRISALDIQRRLRERRYIHMDEPLLRAGLARLVEEGVLDRGDGGWAVTNWQKLGEVGG